MTLAAERAGLPAPGCSAIRRPARKKAGKTHACPPSEAFSNSRRDMPCPVPHASREKHHFRLGYEKSGLEHLVRGARGQRPPPALTRDRQTRLGIYHRLPLGSVHGTRFPCRKSRSMVHSPILRCRESGSGDAPESAGLLLRSNTAESSSSNRFF